jgi:hypothetical protein
VLRTRATLGFPPVRYRRGYCSGERRCRDSFSGTIVHVIDDPLLLAGNCYAAAHPITKQSEGNGCYGSVHVSLLTLGSPLAAMQGLKRVLLRASCPPPFGPACGCSRSLQAIWSVSTCPRAPSLDASHQFTLSRPAWPAAGRCG